MTRPCPHCDDVSSSFCPTCDDTRLIQEHPCNLCGEDMTMLNGVDNGQIAGLKDISVMGGYNSYHLFDLDNYKFSFCEKCLRKLFEQCVIKPKITSFVIDKNISWEEDQTAYEYRVWKNDGGFRQAYLNRQCNAIKDCPNKAIYSLQIDSGTEYETITEQAFCEECSKNPGYPVSYTEKFVKFVSNQVRPFL